MSWRRVVLSLFASTFLVGTGVVADTAVAAPAAPPGAAQTRCSTTTPPGWFYRKLQMAADADSTIPDSWGHDVNMARIVCYESSYRVHATNGSYYGLGQMSKTNIAYYHVSFNDYWNGTSSHPASFYQLLAALRYCLDRYGSPAAGWQHEVDHGWW